jgi:hypothetical protein
MAAEDLLEKVLDAHGGKASWDRVGALRIQVRCGGAALTAKLQRHAYRRYEALLDTRSPRVRFNPFKGGRGVYTPDRVYIETAQGTVGRERIDPRRFFSSGRRHFFWDALDVLYFGGYAMWNYLCTPFLWLADGFALREGDPWQRPGENWRTLKVRFPTGLPTHSTEQVFYIDDRGLIRRHDYTAEVISPYARAVHYCNRHREFGGFVFPTRRRVYPRRTNNRSLPFPTLIWIDIDHITVIAT